MKAWSMAVINRTPQIGLIFHSDKGIHYTANNFRKEITKCKVIQSTSRKSNYCDNSVTENLFNCLDPGVSL